MMDIIGKTLTELQIMSREVMTQEDVHRIDLGIAALHFFRRRIPNMSTYRLTQGDLDQFQWLADNEKRILAARLVQPPQKELDSRWDILPTLILIGFACFLLYLITTPMGGAFSIVHKTGY